MSSLIETLFRNHPRLAGVVEQTAGIHHGTDVAERLEGINFSRRLDGHGRGVEINDSDDILGLENARRGGPGIRRDKARRGGDS